MSSEADRAEFKALKDEIEAVQWQLNSLRQRAGALESRFADPAPKLPPVVPAPVIFAPLPIAQPQETIETPEPEPASLEMRLGTFWFVRIGVVMVLTALVFLGNLAYHKYIPLLGPVGKITLLYLASGGLLALGAWLPRRHEKLRNYSEVLFADGLAAVYFTTYAAHNFPNLRVIQSELLAGVLLLGWTALIVFLADRRKSEALALFGIGLAYYASLITEVGRFTVLSNLILACASVWFLIRNRWLTLGFASLAASYGSYAYWRLHTNGIPSGVEPSLALVGYWIIFTAAVFLTREARFAGVRRSSFLSINNAAAFILVTFSLPGPFWRLALLSGATLLACSAISTRLLADDALPRRAYLAQGLLLTTLGFIARFEGPTLPLILAAESVILLVFATQWKSKVLAVGSILCVALAASWSFVAIFDRNGQPSLAPIFIAAFFIFNSAWSKRKGVDDKQIAESLNALAAVAVLYAFVTDRYGIEARVPIFAALALGGTAMGMGLRSIPFIACAQIFLLGSTGIAFELLQTGRLTWTAGLAPFAVWTILAAVAHAAIPRLANTATLSLRTISFLHQTAGALLGLALCIKFIDPAAHFSILTAIAAVAFLLARSGQFYFLPTAAIFAVAGLAGWFLQGSVAAAEIMNLIPLALIAGAQLFYRRSPGKLAAYETAHLLWIIVASAAFWFFTSSWIIASGAGPRILTTSWAALAFGLFVLGMLIREQTYRWSGLVILTAAVGRVVLLDIWQFQTFHRILSLLALGSVLMLLGYIYTRYEEKISKWL